MNKYRNKKTVHRGIKFDSIAEAEYYDLALWQAEANGWKVKLQERFELMPKFELDGKKYRKIEYIPDFTFYGLAENTRDFNHGMNRIQL